MRITLSAVLLVAVTGLGAVQQPPIFLATAEQVRLEVVVRDRDGQPADALTADDFRIRDSGRLQRINSFLHVLVPQTRRDVLFEEARRGGFRRFAPAVCQWPGSSRLTDDQDEISGRSLRPFGPDRRMSAGPRRQGARR